MAAGDASIGGLGSGLRSDCEAELPTDGLLRRKVPSARGGAWGRAYVPQHATPGRSLGPETLPRRLAPYATIGLISGEPSSDNGRDEMDQLQRLVEALRVLARTHEPNRVALVEEIVDEYLKDKAGIVRLSLERLLNAIEWEEANRRAFEDWSIAREYIHSRLRRLT